MELANLKELRNDMKSKGENFDIFEFKYKGKGYFVIVEVFEQDNKPKYALAKLIFLRIEDIKDKFETWANSNSFLENDVKKIKDFFGIEYSKNGRLFQTLYKALGAIIPITFDNSRKDERLKKDTLLNYVIVSDPKDPNKKYLFDVRRNGGKRSPFNDEKTKLKNPEIYSVFEDRPEVSFFYSKDPNDEKDVATILSKFSAR
ncbi:DUF6037 family protein [Lysinibacillus xylanilyticus]|uniref:DUF6037 family protein n=1 Tax=Lysinibacillus xylanilyticus TaxID=582475 RepID=UPI00381091E3